MEVQLRVGKFFVRKKQKLDIKGELAVFTLEEGMATHSSIFVWRIPLDRGACQATYSLWGHKDSDMSALLRRAVFTIPLNSIKFSFSHILCFSHCDSYHFALIIFIFSIPPIGHVLFRFCYL